MRRREKDYLLRGDQDYVRQVQAIAGQIRQQVQDSAIAAADQAQLLALLDNYERDFLALVTQNDLIAELTLAMNQAAEGIEPLAHHNLDRADRDMMEEQARLVGETHRQARINLLVVLGAVTLGILFTLLLTRPIVRPVRQMAGLLDRLTHESPRERISTVPGSRDEINAMAESLNTLADHRANFMNWWKAAMDEARALRKLHEASIADLRDEALEELRRAALSQVQQLNALRGQVLREADQVETTGQRLRQAKDEGLITAATALERSVNNIRTLLKVTA
jgi:methyl-accepting chemotaxis protein